jgi:ABC-2 type transport system permease protein
MFSLVRKEVNSFLNSIIGYVVILVFLVTISLFLWIFPGGNFNIPDGGYASMEGLFVITPYVYLFLIPAITMRLFSEEKKTGTIELLLTKPLTEIQVVFAKYISGLVLVLFSLLPTLIYYITIYKISLPQGNVDSGAIAGSYLGLLLLGAGFTAIGIFASSISDNQVVAFIIAFFLCLFCLQGFESIAGLSQMGWLSTLLFSLGINSHYLSLSRGVIDTRDVIYFISLIALFLMMTKTVMESRKW